MCAALAMAIITLESIIHNCVWTRHTFRPSKCIKLIFIKHLCSQQFFFYDERTSLLNRFVYMEICVTECRRTQKYIYKYVSFVICFNAIEKCIFTNDGQIKSYEYCTLWKCIFFIVEFYWYCQSRWVLPLAINLMKIAQLV